MRCRVRSGWRRRCASPGRSSTARTTAATTTPTTSPDCWPGCSEGDDVRRVRVRLAAEHGLPHLDQLLRPAVPLDADPATRLSRERTPRRTEALGEALGTPVGAPLAQLFRREEELRPRV